MSSSSDSDDLVDTAEPHSLLFCEKKPHNFRGSSVEVTVTQTTYIFQLMQIKLFKCKLSTFGEARREPTLLRRRSLHCPLGGDKALLGTEGGGRA